MSCLLCFAVILGLFLYFYRKIILDRLIFKCVDKSDEESVAGKTVLITGANAGIGKETAKEMLERGANVILACRNLTAANEAIEEIRRETSEKVSGESRGNLTAMKLDLGSLSSVREFAAQVKKSYNCIHILILNAGVMLDKDTPRKFTSDGFEIHFGVNHLGHFLLANLLLDLVKKAEKGRIVTVGAVISMRGEVDFNDIQFEKRTIKYKKSLDLNQLYANSKLCNNLFSYELSRRLEREGCKNVNTYVLCPGIIKTELGRDIEGKASLFEKIIFPFVQFLLFKTAIQGCQTTLYCALSKKCTNQTGKLYRHVGLWDDSKFYFPDSIIMKGDKLGNLVNSGDSRKLWEVSEKLVGGLH